MLKVWGRRDSFNLQKVMWCVGELGIAHERIDAGGTHGVSDTAAYLAMNPNGKVPTIDDDRFVLWESNAIVRYLAAKHGLGSLCPEDPQRRADADRWMDWQCATVGAVMRPLTITMFRTKPEAPFQESKGAVDLTAADIIVSVGRGIKDPDNIPMARELADAIGGELAASRPICDNGWLPLERQIGSSGQTVSPNLYLALGISGAIQHVVGMKGAKTIVAINKDEGAPIFEIADYGIVADLFEVVPALTEALKNR